VTDKNKKISLITLKRNLQDGPFKPQRTQRKRKGLKGNLLQNTFALFA